MKKTTKPLDPTSVESQANDVLETAEMLRASNILVRTSQGIVFMANHICKAEVLSEEEFKKFSDSLASIIDVYSRVYASLMGRYSALISNSTSHNSTNGSGVNN